jgi:hypothetical protein
MSDKVALGTDGYPSRMDEEAEALLETGLAGGETRERLLARREAGAALFAACWGGAPPAAPPVAASLPVGLLASIRAAAREAAPRLWARLASL